jgi:basic amino acid/polyamine antiporter, APA family
MHFPALKLLLLHGTKSSKETNPLFTRKSTGLVRKGRWLDSLIFDSSASFFFGPLVFSLSSLFFLQGDDLISAEGIALIFALAIAAMYAILTSIMPRSGGDYVFNSRILHPVIGFSFNFSLTVWQLFSAAFTLFFIFYVALSPALEVLSSYLGNPALFDLGVELGNPITAFLLATAVNALFTLITLTGIRKIFTTLNVLWGVTILGTLALVISLIFVSRESFANSFNSFMLKANGTSTSPDSYRFVVNSGLPFAPVYQLAIPAIAICASSVIWVFYETYVSGEIRGASRFSRNLSTMGAAACLNAGLFALLVYLLYLKVGDAFISSMISLSFTTSLPFPGGPLQALTAVLMLAAGDPYSAILVIAAITLGYTILLLPPLYLQPIRSIFAWSFDRVVPASFSTVSSRFHSPLYATIAVFAIIEAGIVMVTVEYASLLGIFFAVIIAPAFSSIFPTSLSAIALNIRSSKRAFVATLSKRLRAALFVVGTASLAFILFMTYIFVANESYFFESSFFSPSFLIGVNFVFIPLGALVYFVSYSYRKKKGQFDLNSIASEIPPE